MNEYVRPIGCLQSRAIKIRITKHWVDDVKDMIEQKDLKVKRICRELCIGEKTIRDMLSFKRGEYNAIAVHSVIDFTKAVGLDPADYFYIINEYTNEDYIANIKLYNMLRGIQLQGTQTNKVLEHAGLTRYVYCIAKIGLMKAKHINKVVNKLTYASLYDNLLDEVADRLYVSDLNNINNNFSGGNNVDN